MIFRSWHVLICLWKEGGRESRKLQDGGLSREADKRPFYHCGSFQEEEETQQTLQVEPWLSAFDDSGCIMRLSRSSANSRLGEKKRHRFTVGETEQCHVWSLCCGPSVFSFKILTTLEWPKSVQCHILLNPVVSHVSFLSTGTHRRKTRLSLNNSLFFFFGFVFWKRNNNSTITLSDSLSVASNVSTICIDSYC